MKIFLSTVAFASVMLSAMLAGTYLYEHDTGMWVCVYVCGVSSLRGGRVEIGGCVMCTVAYCQRV